MKIAAETDLQTIDGPRRVSVSVQGIQENGDRMGALVTLRDLESIESHQHATASIRTPFRNWTDHRGRRARSEKSTELDAALARKSERESASGKDMHAMKRCTFSTKKSIAWIAVVKRFLDFTRPMEGGRSDAAR